MRYLLFLLLTVRAVAAPYALPAVNQGAWTAHTNVGVSGGIDQYRVGGASARTTLINVTSAPYNADNTGATSAVAAITAAKDAATAGQVIYMPAGTYLIDTQLNILDADDDKTFRGDGPGLTILHGTAVNGTMLAFGGTDSSGTYPQTVTGTKTKGTATLTVASSADYSVGQLATVIVENETDNARIIAGAAPTWSHSGYPDLRRVLVKVTAVPSGTTVTVDPPLPWDCTPVAVRIERGSQIRKLERIGLEDFSITYATGSHPRYGISFSQAIESWAYNIESPEWTKNTSAGSMFFVQSSYRTEVRKCKGITPVRASSGDDGWLQFVSSSNCLVEDNIAVGWDYGIYNSGATVNNVVSYNYLDADTGLLVAHDAHPSLDLYEGNVTNFAKTDNYHGSSSHLTFHRNWISNSASQAPGVLDLATAFGRFSRSMALVGNVFGEDGVIAGIQSYGNPNIGNGNASGFAGPTGTSTAVGTYDYMQDYAGPFTYQIQSGDVFSGDFWADWKAYGTLTTRGGVADGTITAVGGNWVANPAGSAQISVWWNGGANRRINMTLVSVAGSVLTVTGGSYDDLPMAGTVFDSIWGGPNGWQERDLDVEPSTIKVENYNSAAMGSGSLSNGTADTLLDSMVYAAKPAWFGGLAWPPVDPNNRTGLAVESIPAGYRYINDAAPPEPSGTTITTGSLSIGGTLSIGN